MKKLSTIQSKRKTASATKFLGYVVPVVVPMRSSTLFSAMLASVLHISTTTAESMCILEPTISERLYRWQLDVFRRGVRGCQIGAIPQWIGCSVTIAEKPLRLLPESRFNHERQNQVTHILTANIVPG